jgi:hypothetical protein
MGTVRHRQVLWDGGKSSFVRTAQVGRDTLTPVQ